MAKNQSTIKSLMTDEVYSLLINAGGIYTRELKKMALEDSKMLDLLVKVFLSDEKKLCWHAGWVLFKVADTHKDLLVKYLPSIINKLPNMHYDEQCHGALRIIKNYDISDENQQGILVDIGIKFILLNKYPPYLKYFSILIIDNIAHYYPELRNELALAIEAGLPNWTTNYIVNMGKKKLAEFKR